MTRSSLCLSALLVLAVALPAAGAEPGAWTPDDIVKAESAEDWAVSRDGALAVWVRSGVVEVEGAERRAANLWLTRLADGSAVQLTRGTDTVSAPAFSPDGAHIAFLSTRALPGGKGGEEPGKTQLWAIRPMGGEAFPVTRFDRSVRAFGWADSGTLLVAAQESPSEWELERKRAKDDSVVVDDADHEPPVRLYIVALEGGQVRRISANTDWIDSVAVSPDGKRAVVTAQRSLSYEFDQRVPPRTALVDLPGGATHDLFTDGVLLPRRVRWAPDSASFYFANEYSRDPRYRTATVTQLWSYDLATARAEQVELNWPRGLGDAYAPIAAGVVALLADGVHFRPALVRRTTDGWRRDDLAGVHAHHLAAIAGPAGNDTILYEYSSATTPPQWYAARLEASTLTGERRLTDLNPGYAGKPAGKVEVAHWEGARGAQVEGLLHYPLAYEVGKRYPLILVIHGGPTGTDMDLWQQSWSRPVILWRQKGAFVLQVNYHGSGGYGLDWVESIGGGRYYDLEIPDLEAGVNMTIARGLVDPARLATAGWSNGGILSLELITRDNRFKAASVGAADVEWISDWGNVDFGAAFDNYYLGGAPWEIPRVYMEKSPLFRLTAVTTPTVVYTGTEDRNVPPSQSWSLFRALQQIGRAPVRLVLFPGEPHGLRVVAHQRRKISEDGDWFDRYLFGRPGRDNEAIREGSPLAGLLARAGAARAGAAFGLRRDDALVPETVPFQGLQVGRFEVTRAQWAAFDPSVAVTPGDENMPMTGVTFAQAEAYAAWLSERTGRAYRLPTVDEAERLTRSAGDKGNTLDRWAGYTPNPEDCGRIAHALASLGSAPLLRVVGSLPGVGEPAVFDLDGNAAEWARGTDGSGTRTGPSADRPTDPRSAELPSPAYVGFRVILDAARSQ